MEGLLSTGPTPSSYYTKHTTYFQMFKMSNKNSCKEALNKNAAIKKGHAPQHTNTNVVLLSSLHFFLYLM